MQCKFDIRLFKDDIYLIAIYLVIGMKVKIRTTFVLRVSEYMY